ncbi:PREDICTED: protein DGCR6-like isoform X2 [Cercocebus atys]|uniref:protein DGCR6-like isoform X2 n=1 Tax=Cercocebus atys TaxID=9531 RepID=UPI0005F46C7D|nr:PREDICTED: protein DGCR6-like isoform X2 [Cercocebus atys]
MERYAGALEEVADGARQQERHYQLLSALQSLVKELPSSFQQRLSYTTLSDLALALLDGTVFEIVQGLLEIQHLTEKSLYNQRLRLQNEHRGAQGQRDECSGRRCGRSTRKPSRPAGPTTCLCFRRLSSKNYRYGGHRQGGRPRCLVGTTWLC